MFLQTFSRLSYRVLQTNIYLTNINRSINTCRKRGLSPESGKKTDSAICVVLFGVLYLVKRMEQAEKSKSPYELYTERQIKAAFEVFDEDRNGRAKLKHLGTILRALCRVVTKAELKEIEEKVADPENPKYMRLDNLLPVGTKLLLNDGFKSAPKSELLKAFAVIDREGKGYIDADNLKKIFKEYGQIPEDDLLEKFICDAVQPGTKIIYYKDFCEKLVVPASFDIEDTRRKIRLDLSRESSKNNN